ncbi:Tethering factor for nuclear proteasome sts1 [Xylographa parallela]|nr:Tethering factor for nuclear proteasome sts1 [Xylographa parallela]
MNSIISTPQPFPHNFYPTRLSPNRTMSFPSNVTSTRKRKADDDDLRSDDRMSASPSTSPAISSQSLPLQRAIKRARSGPAGRPLALPRLLETLDAESLRSVLRTICEHHPSIGTEVVNAAPRPSVTSALEVLKNYETSLQASFPFGGNSTSDYSYNRVRQPLVALLDALNDFTPHFLPPNEPQATQALSFLDGATEIIHRLPNWDSFQNSLHKQNAYEEISKAWALVLREAAKRAGGMQLQYGGWDQKLAKHNQQAQGRMQEAVSEMNSILGWMGGDRQLQQGGSRGHDISSVRQELLSGTFGAGLPVRVGPW